MTSYWPLAYASRILVFANLPTLVFGTSSMNDQRSGSCQRGTCSARNAFSSAAVAVEF